MTGSSHRPGLAPDTDASGQVLRRFSVWSKGAAWPIRCARAPMRLSLAEHADQPFAGAVRP